MTTDDFEIKIFAPDDILVVEIGRPPGDTGGEEWFISIDREELERLEARYVEHQPPSESQVIDLTGLGSPGYAQFEAEVIRLTNQERANHGLAPLSYNADLAATALLHTLDMAEHRMISHTGSDGSDLKTRFARGTYRYYTMIGENLAMGYTTPEAVVQGWMTSPGHRANLLRTGYREIGVGYIEAKVYTTDGGLANGGYWTQHFGSRYLG